MWCSTEKLTPSVMAEIDVLIAAQRNQTHEDEGLPPFSFNWPAFVYGQQHDQVVVTCARDERDRMIAVAIYVVMDHPHHKGYLVADCDLIAVDPARRGLNIGHDLYSYTEGVLKARGVKRITNRYRTGYGVEPAFAKWGFKAVEHVYMKEI